ncbi:IS110 family transposase [Deinococcus sp. KSM4-11]|uniref:IS110 family transposase n=1 Tax=Deinococcus sp. KSM4-11 TaxID=2568654 RepID=UPI0010A4417B|nr:IS110 family transposase [Deinococcus sp. KSM4-11]THF84334.1 IS110 family transposase [Deinococcus sp. KSM4-11]
MAVLGIDVGKDELYVSLRSQKGESQGKVKPFPNTAAGHRQLVAWLRTSRAVVAETQVVMESTSVYWETIAMYLHEAGYVVSIVNAAQIRFFGKSLLKRGKTDVLDAELIAHYGAAMHPACWMPPETELVELRALMRGRASIVELITLEKGRHHAMEHQFQSSPVALRWIEARQAFLAQQLDEADTEIRTLIKASLRLHQHVELLSTVPGIGLLTASVLLTETMTLGQMEHADQWAAYAGLSPMPHQSGHFVGKTRISKIGNARLRRTFYLSALTASRMTTPFGDFYRRLTASGKPKKVALIALARKIIRVCFAVLKSGQAYDPGYTRALQPGA